MQDRNTVLFFLLAQTLSVLVSLCSIARYCATHMNHFHSFILSSFHPFILSSVDSLIVSFFGSFVLFIRSFHHSFICGTGEDIAMMPEFVCGDVTGDALRVRVSTELSEGKPLKQSINTYNIILTPINNLLTRLYHTTPQRNYLKRRWCGRMISRGARRRSVWWKTWHWIHCPMGLLWYVNRFNMYLICMFLIV